MVFGEDPVRYLRDIDVPLACPVRPARTARFDPEYMAWVNHEAYFFSSRRELKRFQRAPWQWCGRVTDPVTLERFEPASTDPQTVYADRPYFFRSEESLAQFLADPEPLRRPRNRMTPPAGDTDGSEGSR